MSIEGGAARGRGVAAELAAAGLLASCLASCIVPEDAATVETSTLTPPASGPAQPTSTNRLAYPKTKKVEQVDDYGGTKVADPYRWLEDLDSAETAQWVKTQNEVTEGWLSQIPARTKLFTRITQLFSYERRNVFGKVNGTLFFSRNTGLQPQNVIFKQAPDDARPVALIDPNQFSKDGTVAIGGFRASDDARYVAYALAEAGSDWSVWRVRDVTTQTDLPDRIQWSKFAGVSWLPDSSGFYYSRFPEPTPGDEREAANRDHQIWFHKLGEPQSADVLVYERPDQPDWLLRANVTDDGRWLTIDVSPGSDRRNRFYYRDLSQPDSEIVRLIDEFEANYDFLGNDGTVFYFRTDLDAPNSRIIAIDVTAPERASWKEIVPASSDALNGASMIAGRLVLNYLHDASTRVELVALDGTREKTLELPGIGTAGGFGGRNDDTETYYTYSSFTAPPTTYHYDFTTGKSTRWFAPKIEFDFAPYETRLVFATSKDGTKVPVHVTCRKDLELDGKNPCVLYGYGGFTAAMTPNFNPTRLAWLEMGGVYAQAVLRGGSEYGEAWHQAGMLDRKQNVFDDFVAAAEHLIATGVTSRSKLAIQGGSNGGLLVGACMTQRPELFAAAIPAVGVLDMLRFHRFTIGKAWIGEYGCADQPEQFPWLYAYSPLHNLEPGTSYPATLILTGDHDDRVVPSHSFKFAAALQEAQGGDAPALIRIETRAGHGAGKSTEKIIEEQADVYSFLVRVLGVEPTKT